MAYFHNMQSFLRLSILICNEEVVVYISRYDPDSRYEGVLRPAYAPHSLTPAGPESNRGYQLYVVCQSELFLCGM